MQADAEIVILRNIQSKAISLVFLFTVITQL